MVCPFPQGIGLRPQPWAGVSRPVGPVGSSTDKVHAKASYPVVTDLAVARFLREILGTYWWHRGRYALRRCDPAVSVPGGAPWSLS